MTQKQSYRGNPRLELLKTDHEIGQATLDKLTSQGEISFHENPALDDALRTMGFERIEVKSWQSNIDDRPLYTDDFHSVADTIDNKVLYARRGSETTEILSEYALDQSKRRLSLYQIPAEQDIQGWFDEIPRRMEKHETRKVKHWSTGIIIGGFTASGTIIASGLAFHYASPIAVLAFIAAYHSTQYYLRRHPLRKELISSGPKALQYIKKTTFEDVLRYDDQSKLRIEVPKEHPFPDVDHLQQAEAEADSEAKAREDERKKHLAKKKE